MGGSAVLELIEFIKPDGSNWIRGYDAVDKFNQCVGIFDDFACRWCLIGMIHRVYGKDIDKRCKVQDKLLSTLTQEGNIASIMLWNDDPNRTVGDVINLCKRASNVETNSCR